MASGFCFGIEFDFDSVALRSAHSEIVLLVLLRGCGSLSWWSRGRGGEADGCARDRMLADG